MAGYWPTGEDDPAATDAMREFSRIWKPMPKIVFSTSLDRVDHNSRLVRGDVADVLDDLRAEFRGDLDVGGPDLAGQFVRSGLVDEYQLVVHPVVLGSRSPLLARARSATAPATHRDASVCNGGRAPYLPTGVILPRELPRAVDASRSTGVLP